ncbi:sensor histidine kinase [Actinoplanes subtropicus]|uniref:sensor histidine kinase n=1 Tax=Actinoplanes subtropicus TaxID=543632 RepID=UPI0012F7A877|nr:sensor histidine kinase [Actinoplanes subtropicus]
MSSEVDGRIARRWSAALGSLRRRFGGTEQARAAEAGPEPAMWTTVVATSAKRSLGLVDRLIHRIDKLEFGEADPARLAELFELDHLITQIRHHERSLLVLADADAAAVRRSAESLTDVLRAAQSEIEQYTRVDVVVTDLELSVAAAAANDLVHLIAELLDNATKHSTPDTTVMIEAHRAEAGVVIGITDRGPGIPVAELGRLNDRLGREEGDVGGMLGMAVVARLAARHGVTVQLRRTEDGTDAQVTLPAALIVTAEDAPEPIPATLPHRPVREPGAPLADRVRSAVGPRAEESGGDFRLREGAAEIVVRVKDNPPMVDVLSPIRTEVDASERLYAQLSELTAGMPIGRLYWADNTVWCSVPVFGHDFQPSHVKLAVQVMTGLAKELGEKNAWPV